MTPPGNGPFRRFEFKYELTPSTAEVIDAEITRFGMKPDRHTRLCDGSYVVSSLYYDSFDLYDYHDKTGGFLERKKLRARIYEPFLAESEHVWLEVKRRYDSTITKYRITMDRPDWERFCEEGISFLLRRRRIGSQSQDTEEFLEHFIRFSAKPRVFVRYRRKARINESENVRVTFDYNIEACRKHDLGRSAFMTAVTRGVVIMEIKVPYLVPAWLGNVIRTHDLKKEAVSKYTRSMEAIHRFSPISR